jgi:hypothetical protein
MARPAALPYPGPKTGAGQIGVGMIPIGPGLRR